MLFTTQQNRWLAPRRARLEDAATAGGEVVISLTDETSARFDLWIIPAAELMAAIQQADFSPSLDQGNAYNFNLQTDDAADMIRQLNWNIRPYRRESGQTDLTRARFWPDDRPPRPGQKTMPLPTANMDVATRLAQWKTEATDPNHPNHYHANLDEPARVYAQITASLRKLRDQPEAFDRDDVAALFGALNSGKRTKNKVADGNPLPTLRASLLALVDGEGEATTKIDTAASVIKFARNNMLGELYGWANAETAPLYNGCARDAMTYLGYQFNPSDYNAFVAAHEEFKQVYRAQVGHLRSDLPLNLEIDRLYNVIDKVDLKQKGPVQNGPEVTDPPTMVTAAFSPQAFELLTGLQKEPSKTYYQAHKDEFKAEIEEPFQRLMTQVASQLPTTMRVLLETQRGIFGRILKNDWGKGGAWGFYWGAFYPKGGKRTQDAQLFVGIHPGFVHFGFSIGAYASEQRQRFHQNCGTHHATLIGLLSEVFADARLVFGRTESLTIAPDGKVSSREACTWEEFLAEPDRASSTVGIVIPEPTLVSTSDESLVADVTQTFERLFPLVLLAVHEKPLGEIADYLDAVAPESDEDNQTVRTIQPDYPQIQFASETGFPEEELAGWVRAIERKGQAILYGPPGTGKTLVAERLARHLVGGGDGFWDLVQFHPAYAYEDFIQGIRPRTTDGGGLSYPTEPGRFLEFCARAAESQGKCVLIIDEINRANLARVFGELMYLMEYRNRQVPLAGGGTLCIPTNVRLIGTMNTADRSIALVDHALRRRFAFLALYPHFDVLRGFHQRLNTGYPVEKLVHVLNQLNNAIHDRHYHVGVTYFLRETLATEIADIWHMEIEPYLDEYFFDQPDKADAFRWERVETDLQP